MHWSAHDGQRRRQLRLRVLETLEQRVKQFLRRDELWPLRVPREPLLLDAVIAQALPDDAPAFDRLALRSRPLIHFEWDDGSEWEAWVIVLPSGVKLYCDTNGDESRVLASGGRNDGDQSDRAFLTLLAQSAGAHFGIEMAGGAPSLVRSAITERGFLIDLFVELFELTAAEASVREQLECDGNGQSGDDGEGHDFRREVEQWLAGALGGAPAG